MEETGEWIIKQNGDDPEVVREVHTNVQRAQSQIDEVTIKLSDRRRRLETALTEHQRVHTTFDDFNRRVVKVDRQLVQAKPVSPALTVIKLQRESHEVSHVVTSDMHVTILTPSGVGWGGVGLGLGSPGGGCWGVSLSTS